MAEKVLRFNGHVFAPPHLPRKLVLDLPPVCPWQGVSPVVNTGVVGNTIPMVYCSTPTGWVPDINFISFVIRNIRWDARGCITDRSVYFVRFLAELYVSGCCRVTAKSRVSISSIYKGDDTHMCAKPPSLWLRAHVGLITKHTYSECHGTMHKGVGQCDITPLGTFHTSEPLCHACYRSIFVRRDKYAWKNKHVTGPWNASFLDKVIRSIEEVPVYHILVGMALHVVKDPHTPPPNEAECAADGQRAVADPYLTLFLTTPKHDNLSNIFLLGGILGAEAWRLAFKLQ